MKKTLQDLYSMIQTFDVLIEDVLSRNFPGQPYPGDFYIQHPKRAAVFSIPGAIPDVTYHGNIPLSA